MRRERSYGEPVSTGSTRTIDGFTFAVSDTGGAAQFEQIRAQVTEAALAGTLAAGTRLPPIRRLAVELGLSANTVARAYRELESDGVVITSGKRGTFVAEPSGRSQAPGRHPTDPARRAILRDAAKTYAAAASSVGFGPQEAVHELREVLAESPPR